MLKPSIRAVIAILLLAGTAFVSDFRLLRQGLYAPVDSICGIPVLDFDMQFEEIRRDLPPHMTIGYASWDTNSPALNGTKRDLCMRFTQFSIAPRVLIDSKKMDYVLGVFPNTEGTPIALDGLILVRDYGNGLYLYKRADN